MSGPAGGRRELGQRLAAVRKAAGLTQVQLAAVAGYSRSTVSCVEAGSADVARQFWARCDQALRTGRAFAAAFDQVAAAERRQAAGLPEAVPDTRLEMFRRAWQRITGPVIAAAAEGYRELGWAIVAGEGDLGLVTGVALST